MATKPIVKKSCGSCDFRKPSPPVKKPETINVHLNFEDALKLNAAIQEGVRRLNSYNRSTKKGKNAALCLAVFLGKNRITVTEVNLAP